MSRLQQRLMEARQSILEQIVIRQSKKKRRAAAPPAPSKAPEIARTPAVEPPPPKITIPPQQEVFPFIRPEEGDYRLPPSPSWPTRPGRPNE
ncbi:MAG: hypothetical protein MPW15_17180 [Candidatus Manganitrophus sp.]|nr:hypothetical protein [Candidatus Manganitrophus sp.]